MLGKTVTLHRSNDSGSTYGTAIADIINIEPGEKTAETVENTTYGSSHDYKEYDYGMKDGGEYSITVRYKAGQTDVDAIEDSLDNSVKEHLQLQFPAPISKTESFRCLVTKVGRPLPRGEHIDRVIGLKVDGVPTSGTLT
ncbi:MAG: hypothetical protein MK214_14980 [Thalassotalea sp.]|nr:hypothetical protein [Thalassotalea sp.]